MADEVLHGAAAIAAHLKIGRRKIYALVDADRLPVWREGRSIFSTRTLVDGWLSERKSEARAHCRVLEHA